MAGVDGGMCGVSGKGPVQIQGREMTGERERGRWRGRGRESNRTAAAAELWLHVAGLR